MNESNDGVAKTKIFAALFYFIRTNGKGAGSVINDGNSAFVISNFKEVMLCEIG